MECKSKLAILISGSFSGDEDNADPYSLLRYLPEDLAKHCELIDWSCQPSSHYSMPLMLEMSDMFNTLIEKDYAGIIVISGTGVMSEMSYMADLLWQNPEPVIFANLMVKGRAGLEEGLKNLNCSVLAALSPEAQNIGVLVCSSGELFAASDVVMIDPLSQDNIFQSVRKGSLGKMINGNISFTRTNCRPEFLARRPERIPLVEIVTASMGGGEKAIAAISNDKEIEGFVLSGFGTGNILPSWVPHVRNLIRRRVPVAIVSRCFQGQVAKTGLFEGSFAKLVDMGVLSGGKLSANQARIRMSLGIGAGLTELGLSLYLLNKPVCDDTPALYK
ncbi:MAG: asparaginase [Synergistaceae bacterium]|nr:asparaginase [Synergistaceae bacterium]